MRLPRLSSILLHIFLAGFDKSGQSDDVKTNELEIIGALAVFLLKKTGSIYGTFTGRLTAAEQREAFGCVPFGKLNVTIDGEKETVGAYRKICFGSDWEATDHSWSNFEKLCRSNRHPFSLGRYALESAALPL